MKQAMHDIFVNLLQSSGGLGVGMVDMNGLLIHSEGDHDGRSSNEVAALLLALYPPQLSKLEQAFQDPLSEHIVIGREHCFYLLRIQGKYVLYALTGSLSSKARNAMHQARGRLNPLLKDQGLLAVQH